MALSPEASTALSQALALQLPPNSLQWLGTSLQLRVNPTATASQRRVDIGADPLESQATALGLGFGDSRFLPAFFNSPRLSVIGGGGLIQGAANATATATGNNDSLVHAKATNIGIANVDYLSRSTDPLWVGTGSDPFQATAKADSRSLLPAGTPLGAMPGGTLQAQAVVRGVEGSPDAASMFYGQPNANVRAAANLDLDPASLSGASASADAAGIENTTIYGISNRTGVDARAIDAAVAITGNAAVNWSLQGTRPLAAAPVQLQGEAIGIERSTITGAARATTLIAGSGLAALNSALSSNQVVFTAPVRAIGIDRSTITTGLGTTLIMGTGAAASNLGQIPGAIVAGIADTTIIGQGNTLIEGTTPDTPGTNGILRSEILAANGNTSVFGTATDTRITSAAGTTTVQLEGARDVHFQGGGFGNDAITLKAGMANTIRAGMGNDAITIGAGGGNVLDGGFGQNLITSLGGASRDTFVKANAGAALDAAVGRSFAEQLADPAFWNALTSQQKQNLWSTGEYRENGTVKGRVDTTVGFDPGTDGDTLALSSSLASMTQAYWQTNGAIFGIDNGALKVMDGPANSTMGLISGSLADIRSLVGTTGCSLAYASDTRQLLFDADGNWSQGSRSIGQLSMSDGDSLRKDNIQFA